VKGYTCPCCGYGVLREPPRSASGGGSYEICPSCGFEFGVTDDDEGFAYSQWRARWKKLGCPWTSVGIAPPRGWDAKSQLAKVEPAKKNKSAKQGN